MGGYILVYKIKNKGSNWGYTNCFFNINIKNIPLKEYGCIKERNKKRINS
jgi:hypothetical protein